VKLYLLLVATPSGPMLFGLFPDPAACNLVINALGLRHMAVCGAGYGRASVAHSPPHAAYPAMSTQLS